MLVVPARPGLLVADPARGDYLPAAGREVPQSSYWMRRLRDGDVLSPEDAAAAGRPADERPPRPRAKER